MSLQEEVDALVAHARQVGADSLAVEIKKAEGGAPKTLPETISAFANGNGGVIVLGLDEDNQFSVVPIKANAVAEALVSACSDRVTPPVRAQVEVVQVDGKPVVAASIPPCDIKQRPCYVATRGIENGSYIRAHDGDRHLTTYEIHLLVDGRGQPRDDSDTVDGASIADLEQSAIDELIQRFRATRGPAFLDAPQEDILRMVGICPRGDSSNRVSLAGLLTLGIYPQEFFPQLNVTFVSYPTSDGGPMTDGTRFLENVSIDGTIPQMVSRLVEVVTRSMTRRSVMVGVGREDVWEYPVEAVRELVVNALMHRDYHSLARGTQVRVEMYPNRLVFLNPGGLYGAANPEELLSGRATSSRNASLARLLEDVNLPGSDRAICENRGSGMTMIQQALSMAGLESLCLTPSVGMFVAEIRNGLASDHRPMNVGESVELRTDDIESIMLTFLSAGPKTNHELQAATGLGRQAISKRLQGMEKRGLVAPTESRRSPNVRWELNGRSVLGQTFTRYQAEQTRKSADSMSGLG